MRHSYEMNTKSHTTLIFADTDNGGIIHVANIKGGVGKSTTAVNAACGLAQRHPQRVLLVDADLRRPAQHRLANCPRAPGLSDVLAGKCDIESAIRRSVAPGIFLI